MKALSSTRTVACTLLASGSRTPTPPLVCFHVVSFSSSVSRPTVVIFPLWRFSRKYPVLQLDLVLFLPSGGDDRTINEAQTLEFRSILD